MTKKLSPQKLAKMMTLYFQGWSQVGIADKLKINQATVSLHVGKLKALALEKGVQAITEEYGFADTVGALHSLGAELKKSGLTVEECQAGLKMQLLFQKMGVKEDQYGQLINACKRMKEEGFIVTAIKLAHLEESTGLTYEQVLADYEATHKDLAKANGELQATNGKVAAVKEELAEFEKQKAAAGKTLQAYLDQVGADMERIKLVEHLAKTLKAAGISNQDLQDYIQRQQALNKAGIDIGLFTAILDKTKLVTSLDHGEGLLKSLSKYGGLEAACAGLKAEAKVLKAQATGLEQQAALKGKIEVEISKLKAEKAGLGPLIADLNAQYQTVFTQRNTLQQEVALLEPKKAALEQETGELMIQAADLNDDIEAKEKVVADLDELTLKRDAAIEEVADLQAKRDHDKKGWAIYQGFRALVGAASVDELKDAAKTLLAIIEWPSEDTYTKDVDFLKNRILQDMTGKRLPFSLRCITCGASIITDRPAPPTGYQCPNAEPFPGSPHRVIVEGNPATLLETALSFEPQRKSIVVQRIEILPQLNASDGKP